MNTCIQVLSDCQDSMTVQTQLSFSDSTSYVHFAYASHVEEMLHTLTVQVDLSENRSQLLTTRMQEPQQLLARSEYKQQTGRNKRGIQNSWLHSIAGFGPHLGSPCLNCQWCNGQQPEVFALAQCMLLQSLSCHLHCLTGAVMSGTDMQDYMLEA